ncbi:response regulator transcription factor [Bradyrhizobium sp. LHD-71]|uniref:response regulator transcription factor n=1 Tax=Bradyrhizobium sp. LHD-71 TaxID=3072141 RepID=UPI00280E4DEE|nr:response regulator transcription factor [Bradyrhizobium sp. LHD-71]MDQ8732699.1 response regulator transcription factor [Bradyrhizobium sp. LHD-71]
MSSQETSTPDPIRVVVAEDQPVIRRAFAAMLSLESDIVVVGEAADGVEAIEIVRAWQPDIVLMDLQMPRGGGIAATRRIVAEHADTQVIVLTTFDTDDLVFEAIAAGAQAYLLKDASEEEILATIRAVKRGESGLSPKIARTVLDGLRSLHPAIGLPDNDAPSEPLTSREERILTLVAEGRSNKNIAETIFLAEGTVKNYVSRIMGKFNVQSRTELALKAARRRPR